MLGERFLLLHHTGRRTGRSRQVVLEVMRHDRAGDCYISASAYGERSDWFRNVLAHPEVKIQVGRRVRRSSALPLDSAEAERELLDYAHRHPIAFRILGWILGQEMKGTDEAVRALAARMPVVAFDLRDPQARC